MAVPAVAFPQLDTLDRTHSISSFNSASNTGRWSREWPSLPDGSNLADTRHDLDLEASRILRRFAAYLQSFTGSEHVSFRFTTDQDTSSQDGSRTSAPSSGVVRTSAEPAATSHGQKGDDQAIAVHIIPGDYNGALDFGISIAQRAFNGDSTTKLTPATLNVFVDTQRLSIEYLPSAIPLPLRAPIFDHLFNTLRSSDLAPHDVRHHIEHLSVLNDPPKALPVPLPSSTPHVDGQPAPTERNTCLYKNFVQRAQEYPNRVAIDFIQGHDEEHVTYTYRELDVLTTALAEKILMELASHPDAVANGQRIICASIGRSPDLYIAWLATLKAGYAFYPLPIELSTKFAIGLVEDISSPLILGRGRPSKSWNAFCQSADQPRLWLDIADFVESRRLVPGVANTNFFLPHVEPHDVAYIMFDRESNMTAGTRSMPVSHLSATYSILSNLQSLPHEFVANNNEFRWFQASTPATIASVLEIFITLSAGGTLCGCDKDLAASEFERAISSASADITMAGPELLATFSSENVPTLRHLWTLGEVLDPHLVNSFAYDSHARSAHDPRHLLRSYVPSGFATNCTLSQTVSVNDRGSIIGYPLPTCSVFILDPGREEPVPVPLGFPGELAIGGPQVGVVFRNGCVADSRHVESDKYGLIYRTGDHARVVVSQYGTLVVDLIRRASIDQTSESARARPSSISRAIVNEALTDDDSVMSVVRRAIAEAVHKPLQEVTLSSTLAALGLGILRASRFSKRANELGLANIPINDIVSCSTVGEVVHAFERFDVAEWTLAQTRLVGQFEVTAQGFRDKHQDVCLRALDLDLDDIEAFLPVTAQQGALLSAYVLSLATPRKTYIEHSIYTISSDLEPEEVCGAWINVLERYDIMRTVFAQVDDDLSPFAQCILDKTCPRAAITLALSSSQDGPGEMFDDLIDRAIQDAEDSITLERPPVSLTLVQVPGRSAIVLSMLHAVFDGGSRRLILQDVEREFRGLAPIERPGITSAVQRHFTSNREEAANHWKSYLHGSPFESFPCLRRTICPEEDVGKNATRTFVSELAVKDLRAAAARMGVSPVSILHLAWASILSAYTGSPDVAFGTIMSDRFTPELAGCAAPLMTVVPVRIDMSDEIEAGRTNSEVALRRTAENAETLKYLHHPFLSVPYDTKCIFQSFDGPNGQEMLYDDVVFPTMTADETVMIEMCPSTTGFVELRATYKCTIMDAESADLLLMQLAGIMTRLGHSPDAPFRAMTLATPLDGTMSAVERAAIIENGFQDETAEKSTRLLHQSFREHAGETPDDLALDFYWDLAADAENGSLKLTYGELNARAETIAAAIVKRLLGLPKPWVVPICMEKCPEMYASILGVLIAGAAWCPVDPTYPAARQHHLFERTATKIILVKSALAEGAIPEGIDTVNVTGLKLGPSDIATTLSNPDLQPTLPTDLAYILFTSGTTGLPKGVAITHEAVSTSLIAVAEKTSRTMTSTARHMQFAAFFFDVFVHDVFLCLHRGGTIISASRDLLLGRFADLANHAGATDAFFTATFASTLRRADFGPTFRAIHMSGEAVPQHIAREWSADGGIAVYEMSGPAETAVHMTLRRLYPSTISSNVGHAFRSCEAHVVDREGHLLMRGGVGELVVAGVYVMQGYWKDPELTAKSCRWNEDLQKTAYHTGDIVRQLADGSFDFVSRVGDMVKIRGMRVELDEIVAVCRHGHPMISQLQVMYTSPSDEKASAGKVLVCFLSVENSEDGKKNAAGTVSMKATTVPRVNQGEGLGHDVALAVRKHASSQLPQHMVPELVMVLSHMPLTASGKIDRRALRTLLQESGMAAGLSSSNGADHDSETPEWATNNASLCAMLRDVVKMPDCNIGPGTALAALGLDSIGAIKLSSRLRRQKYNVSVTDIIRCPTVGDLVTLLGNRETGSACGTEAAKDDEWKTTAEKFSQTWKPRVAEHASPKMAIETFEVAPTTMMQAGVLAESLRSPMSYWASFCYELSSEVDLARLRQAWEALATAYEVLRTGFMLKAALVADDVATENDTADVSGFLQVIHRDAKVDWEETQAKTEDTSADARRVLDNMARKHSAQGYSEPLWGVRILTSSDGKQRTMMLNMHHSLYDGDSVPLLLDDLAMAYEADVDGPEAHGATPPPYNVRCQLREAVTRLNLDRNSDEANVFWQAHLHNIAIKQDSDRAPAPASYMSKPATDGPVIHRTVNLLSALSLPALSRAAGDIGGASANAILRVAWGMMLAEYSEAEGGFLFAEIRSERVRDPRLASAMAPLGGLYPVPFVLEGSPREMVRAQFRFASDCLKHGALDGGAVRQMIGRAADEVLYPAMLVFHSKREGKKCELWEERESLAEMAVEHNFVLNVHEQADDSILLALSVEERTMPEQAQVAFLQQLDAVLQAIIAQPDVPSAADLNAEIPKSLRSISKIRPSFVDQKPADWQPTHWIEHWASIHPTGLGVEILEMDVYSGEKHTVSWTYAKLNSTANKVARWISGEKILDRKIGVCLNRSLLSFAIIIGIMKSGNTYIPIDEDLPPERKKFLLEDGNAAVLFTVEEYFTVIEGLPDGLLVIDAEKPAFTDAIAILEDSNFTIDAPLDSDAYILYTSGSTGKPKGVRVSRGNLSAFMEAQTDVLCSSAPSTPSLAGKGKYLCLASRAFDVHIGEMFLAWRHGLAALAGARMTLLDNLRWTLAELHVTHASFVPSLLDQTGLVPEDAPDLVFLSTGGEKMTPRTQAIWSTSPQVALVNAYGPTEVTIGCCSGHVRPDSDTRCIGRPLGDSIARVLVPGTDRLAKRGVPGELAFSGSLVATGYLNLPPGASSGFVDDGAGGRMYRTGDMVVMLPDDSILFLGRKDDQVKVRGQRLELGEISEAARAAANVSLDVTTTLLKHPEMPGRQQLVTFVATVQTDPANKRKNVKNGTEPTFLLNDESWALAKALKAKMEQRLPAYMVPDLLLPISFVPLTLTSAKADHKLLKKVFEAMSLGELQGDNGDASRHEDKQQKVPARELTPTEMQVVEVIRQVVGASRALDAALIRPDSSVFQLGIDSLGALTVAVRLRRLGFKCAVTDVLQNPTIEQIAALAPDNGKDDQSQIAQGPSDEDLRTIRDELEALDAAVRAALKNGEATACSSAAIESIRPCYPLQEVLVAHSHGDAGADQRKASAKYINHAIFEVDPSCDLEKLKAAWTKVINANEILRTCFLFWGEGIVQLVLKPDHVPDLWGEDARSGDRRSLEAALKACRDDAATNIVSCMASKPPLRLTLATHTAQGRESQPGRCLLMLSIHHALYDADSLAMLINDVQQCYRSDSIPNRPSTAPLTEYIALQKRQIAKAKAHWTSLLREWWAPDNSSLDDDAETKETTIERVVKLPLGELKALSSKLGLTLPAVLQALFCFILARSNPSGRATFGVVLSGRTIAVDGVENMMAPCITTVPQVVNLVTDAQSASHTNSNSEVTLGGLIADVQRNAFASMAYQHTSLRDIQAWIEASGPIFDSIFSYVTPPDASSSSEAPGILRPLEANMPLDYPLGLKCEADAGQDRLTLRTGYLPSMASVAETLLETMELLAKAVLNGDHIPISHAAAGAGTSRTSSKAKFDEGSWSEIELRIKTLVAQFCSVEDDKIMKAAPLVRFGIDSITAIRFARTLREDGLALSSADVLRNPSIGALAALYEKRLQDGSSRQPAMEMAAAITTAGSSTTESSVAPATPSTSDAGSHRPSQTAGSSTTPGTSMTSSMVLSISPASKFDIPKEAKPWNDGDRIEFAYQATPLQAGMLSSSLALDGRLYSHHHAFVLPSGTDLAAVESAWRALLAKHDVLRTSFHPPSEATGSWTAAVHSKPLVRWNIVDVAKGGTVYAALQRLEEETVYTAENGAFTEKPPVKVTIIRDSSSSPPTVLFVASLHHAVYDGISVQYIFSDLQCLLAQAPCSHRPSFHLAASAIAQSSKAATAFWTEQLRGYTGARIANLTAADSPQSSASISLPRVTSAAEALNTTVLNASLLAFGKSLALLCGARDVVFGSVVAGRSITSLDDADAVAGPMFNTLPWRVRLADIISTNKEALAEVGKMNDAAIEYQHVALAEVQSKWRAEVGEGRELFEALFVFNKEPVDEAADGEPAIEKWKPYELDVSGSQEMEKRAGSEYAINFEVVERRDGSVVVSTFARLESKRLEEFVQNFGRSLEDILGCSGRLALAVPEGLADLPLAAPIAREQEQTGSVGASRSRNTTFSKEAVAAFLNTVRDVLAEVAATSASNIGADTSVFSIGVDSIMAIRIAAACKRRGVPLTTIDIIRGIYVGKICEVAFERRLRMQERERQPSQSTGAEVKSHVPLQSLDADVREKALRHIKARPDQVEDILPALAGQEYHTALWLRSGRTKYEPSWVFRSKTSLDPSRLHRAWMALRRQHSILRTCFVVVAPEQMLQVVLNQDAVPDRESKDLTFMTYSTQSAHLSSTLEGAVNTRLMVLYRTPSTMKTPPVRLELIQGDPAKGESDAVLLTLHHATFDAYSMGLLVRDLVNFYHADSPSPVPAQSSAGLSSYARNIVTPMSDAEKSFWQTHLAGANPTQIGGLPAVTSAHGQTFVHLKTTSTRADVEATARKASVTPPAILLAAFARILSKAASVPKPAFVLSTAGRSATEDEDETNLGEISGPLLNFLPFAVEIGTGDTLSLVTRIQHEMSARTAWEQSRLREVLGLWDGADNGPDKKELFNAHLNILWNDDLFVAKRIDGMNKSSSRDNDSDEQPLLEVWPIGLPMTYASTTPIPGTTAVDMLDTSITPRGGLFLDVMPDAVTGCAAFGAWCARSVMDEETLRRFLEEFGEEIGRVVDELRSLASKKK